MVLQTQKIEDEKSTIVDAVRNWGDLNTDAIIDPSCHIFTVPHIEGLVGYRISSGYAIVYGDPVCSKNDKIPLAQAFHSYCKENRLKVNYIIASEEFAKSAMENGLCTVRMEFAEKLIFNPKQNPLELKGPLATLVRKKVKHAVKDNVQVFEYNSHSPQIEEAIKAISDNWLKSRRGPQVYIGNMNLFTDRQGKRWFYAQKGNEIIGVAVINELKEQKAWLLNNVMLKDAPNGTSELLVTSILTFLAQEDCEYVYVGPIPAVELGPIVGLGKVMDTIARTAFILAKKIYHFDRHNKFWEKFQPKASKCYLLFEKNLSFTAIKSLFTAVNATM